MREGTACEKGCLEAGAGKRRCGAAGDTGGGGGAWPTCSGSGSSWSASGSGPAGDWHFQSQRHAGGSITQQLQLPAAAALLLVVAVLPAAAAAHPREALKGSWHLRLRY
jgi:hypothetical protein